MQRTNDDLAGRCSDGGGTRIDDEKQGVRALRWFEGRL